MSYSTPHPYVTRMAAIEGYEQALADGTLQALELLREPEELMELSLDFSGAIGHCFGRDYKRSQEQSY